MASFVMLGLLAMASAQVLTSAMIENMGNNTLFERWRPYSHFCAPAGWMNVSVVANARTLLTRF
jgi:beta-fructofuranosidase